MSADDVTLLLNAVRRGTPDAASRLIEAVYQELRGMAEGKMRAVRPGHTLQPTALVNEAFLRLVGNQDKLAFSITAKSIDVFGAAAKAMERVLVDHARRKQAQKRGGGVHRVTLQDVYEQPPDPDLDVLGIHAAVAALELESPELAMLARHRYFVGLSLEEIAEIDGVSLTTVKRRWTYAKAWLYDRLS